MRNNKITGVIEILIGLFWFYKYLNLIYLYNFTDILFYSMLPDYVLIINLLLGLLVIILGIITILKKIMIKKSMITTMIALIIGITIEIIATM